MLSRGSGAKPAVDLIRRPYHAGLSAEAAALVTLVEAPSPGRSGGHKHFRNDIQRPLEDHPTSSALP
ncbi:hypothetical protein HYQ46_011392 [Verticillium longisporum]|nr:hypothetical protein HYQ46_011392 [Verticillium longisporum]